MKKGLSALLTLGLTALCGHYKVLSSGAEAPTVKQAFMSELKLRPPIAAEGHTTTANTVAQEAAAGKSVVSSGDAAGAATFRIAGTVVDAVSGAAVAGAQVSIMVDGNAVEATAGGDGKFVFDGLKVGKYPLYAQAPGYVQEGLNQHGAFLTGVAVRSGLDSEHIVFKLHPEAVLYGKVTDERGEAVRHAQVMLLAGDGGWGQRRVGMRSQTQTNDLGEYRFAHLRAGKYYVAVEAHPWYAQTGLRYMPEPEPVRGQGVVRFYSGPPRSQPDPMLDVVYPVTFYPGVTDGNAASAIGLDWGESEEADVGLQAVPSVHMLVTNLPADEKGSTNYGVGATARVLGTMEYGLQVTGAQVAPGEYEIAGLPPGEATLHFNGAGGHPENSRTMELNASDGSTVDARGTGVTASVSGQVIFPGGGATRQGQVVLANDDNQNFVAQLKKDGSFAFPPVHTGTYRVFVGLQSQREYVQKVSATGARANEKEITIAEAGNVQLTVTMAQGFGRVTGVAKQDGKPVAGVMVILVPESGQDLDRLTRMDQSDSDGTFTLANTIPGKYVLLAIADGWDLEWAKAGVLKPYLVKGQALQIGADEKKEVTVEAQGKTGAGSAP